MLLKRVCVLYFSPTGGTEKIARAAAGALAGKLGLDQEFFDFTRPEGRETEYRFGPEDLLVMASPVYAGRLPNKLAPEYKAKIFGEGSPAVPLCVFGNRSPDEALRELVLLLEGNGFRVRLRRTPRLLRQGGRGPARQGRPGGDRRLRRQSGGEAVRGHPSPAGYGPE